MPQEWGNKRIPNQSEVNTMLKGIETKDYDAQWLDAEREIATNGNYSNTARHDIFTRDDFMLDLKKASRRIEKPKSSPKSSKT